MNSLFKEYSGFNQQSSAMKKMFDMIKAAQNPEATLNQLIAQNPQMQQVYQIINDNGGDPKIAFYKLAEQKGVNPEEILSMLR